MTYTVNDETLVGLKFGELAKKSGGRKFGKNSSRVYKNIRLILVNKV